MKGILNLGFGAPCDIELSFENPDGAPVETHSLKNKDGTSQSFPVYTTGDAVCGKVCVMPTSAKKVEHSGMKVQLLGQIELASDRHHPHEFVALVRELAPPGELYQKETMDFEFSSVEMQYDAFHGSQVKLKYVPLPAPIPTPQALFPVGGCLSLFPSWAPGKKVHPPRDGCPKRWRPRGEGVSLLGAQLHGHGGAGGSGHQDGGWY
mmetsp:Transcript_2554/g.7243  ORF Transcript_2554/g.7243 Transcript_2554/m.7243 type:complete len:207 (-) Transcript_2554:511-1131(-)